MTDRPKPAAETIAGSIALGGLSIALFIAGTFVGADDPYGYLSSDEEGVLLLLTILGAASGIASTVLLAVGAFRLVCHADRAALRIYDADLVAEAERNAELKRYYAERLAERQTTAREGLHDRAPGDV